MRYAANQNLLTCNVVGQLRAQRQGRLALFFGQYDIKHFTRNEVWHWFLPKELKRNNNGTYSIPATVASNKGITKWI